MFYRLLGKFFFLFYICPRIAREFRFVRKHFNPMLNDIILDAVAKQKEKLPTFETVPPVPTTDIPRTTPTPTGPRPTTNNFRTGFQAS